MGLPGGTESGEGLPDLVLLLDPGDPGLLVRKVWAGSVRAREEGLETYQQLACERT